ncbi:MAG TPA: S41 family peptidase [Anaerolineaceae bacterium]|nr:S41 family peptidase [Anaerolineaceae bacterium]
MIRGYYRSPTLSHDQIVYVCEDDLWTLPAGGGLARRLTSNLGAVSSPSLSPDGRWLAFVGREDGQAEIYRMPAQGGPAQRMTYLGSSNIQTAGWTPDGKIAFASNAAQPFAAMLCLYTLDPEGGAPRRIQVGPARAIAFGPHGERVIGRNTSDPARWKRYRGGTAGQIWIDPEGAGNFQPLIELKGNLTSPMWIGNRVYFLSDHEGVGNLYSCLPPGRNRMQSRDLRRHTDHVDFYARGASSDGVRIVYHAGADLYLFDPHTGRSRQVDAEQLSPQVQRNRRFVDPGRYLETAALHPKGHSIVLTVRGQLFSLANWEGAVLQHSAIESGVRYRLPQWLNDGARLIVVDDSSGDDALAILDSEGARDPVRFDGLDIGRPVSLAVNPKKDQIVFSNHRYELFFLDLETRELVLIDRGTQARIAGMDWSPDGEWVVYSISTSIHVMALKLWKAATREVFPLTPPVLQDVNPSFDPQGKYIYFIGYRTFDPVRDNLQFDFSFPRGMKPHLITLQKDLPSPFIPLPRPLDEEKTDEASPNKAGEQKTNGKEGRNAPPAVEETEKEKKTEQIRIDLEGIGQRVIAFPVEEGLYGRILACADGKPLYTRYPLEGALGDSMYDFTPPANARLLVYDFDEQREDTLLNSISDFDLNRGRRVMLVRAANRLRVQRAGQKPADENGKGPGRKTGWIELERIKAAVIPGVEWRQMFREAWRLQRDHFWNPEMSGVDWLAVYQRYLPLVERVASRSEFSDLMWEMQGELGTSHTYELGGDYRPSPFYRLGNLAADFTYDDATGAWRIAHIVQGDPWDEYASSPLARAGLNLQEGDRLLAVNGQRLRPDYSPEMALVNQANREVNLLVASEDGSARRSITVKTLPTDAPARYREWVERNRQRVHAATQDRVGYVHIPDMGSRGYAEFHRAFLVEVDRKCLIVDLRYNNGGNVSSLLLEKLARRRVGYTQSRWDREPTPYPPDSVLGPLVALTNEHAGSDGDIFSHGFQVLGLGPLIGKRTWGGVVGIWPQQTLVDGTVTTQPEYSFWFKDVGWGVENYGADPDIEIDNTPQDYAAGLDAQLERAITEILTLMQAAPPGLPEFGPRPSRAAPELPPR